MTLGQTGQLNVTLAAARSYADFSGLGLETARRELLELLMDAKRLPEDSHSGAERWRMRRRSTRMDIEALVVRDAGGIASVTHVTVRGQRSTNDSHRDRKGPYRE